MPILVTGGAGYIGSVTVELLRRRGADVVVADDLVRGHPGALPPDVPLEIGDLTDAAFVRRIADRYAPDAVLHFAACSQVGESMRDPGLYFRNNFGGVLQLLETLSSHGALRFILSSTAATYGAPTEIPILETAPAAPTNPYGESKWMCERVLRWYGLVHGVRWISLRYFNAAGATASCGEDHEPETHLIPLALDAVAPTENPLSVFGLDYPTPDGTCIRDYVHVEDLATAHVLALDRLAVASGEIFNLGNGLGFSVLEVIAAVERVVGRTVSWQAGPRREGDPARLVASSARARDVLGWRPAHSDLDEIVRSAWNWRRWRPRGYDDRRRLDAQEDGR